MGRIQFANISSGSLRFAREDKNKQSTRRVGIMHSGKGEDPARAKHGRHLENSSTTRAREKSSTTHAGLESSSMTRAGLGSSSTTHAREKSSTTRALGKFSKPKTPQMKKSAPQNWPEILKLQFRLAERLSDRDVKQALTFFVTSGIIVYLLAGTFTLALPFALAAAYLPFYFTLRNQAKRHRELVEVWPELIDHLLTGLRSGMSIIQALVALEKTGPEITREIIGMAAANLRRGGSTAAFFSQLKAAFADPISDQALEVMQYSREVGGRDTATTLKSLADYARAQISLRQEIVAKRAWIGNSAKIAAAAPWILLLILSLQPTTMFAFRKPEGFLILACGALATIIGYAWMSKVGQIPQPVRILRS